MIKYFIILAQKKIIPLHFDNIILLNFVEVSSKESKVYLV